LKCPYQFKLNNLLKVPRAKAGYLAYGTAVHQAFEEFNQQFIETGEMPDKEILISGFKRALEKEVLTVEEFEQRLKEGIDHLENYYQRYKGELVNPAFAEKFFGYGNYRITVGDIPLTGKIDKIEWIDKQARTVKVTDYKTGRPKTRGQIKGTTKNSDGGYKRQLDFYKLLVDSDPKINLTVKEGEIDFIQKDNRGSFRKEVFEITRQDTSKLKQMIKEVMERIRNFDFGRTEDTTHCARCEYKDHCYPDGLPVH
jgi:DNA helicase II / ATP-dependent DNA helicase PcrA